MRGICTEETEGGWFPFLNISPCLHSQPNPWATKYGEQLLIERLWHETDQGSNASQAPCSFWEAGETRGTPVRLTCAA